MEISLLILQYKHYDVGSYCSPKTAMFDFLFKKRAPVSSTPTIQSATLDKFIEKQSKKQIAMDKAASFDGQESLAVAFILESEFAEARLQAATYIHSSEALMQVSQAMRNTDRRVSKLVQEKLSQLHNQEKMDLAVQNCLFSGLQLLEQNPLMVNQVADWDKKRLALGEAGLSLIKLKSDLEHRLEQQLDLQRQALQLSANLRSLSENALQQEEAQSCLTEYSEQWQKIQADSRASSLPTKQVHQINDEFQLAQSHIEQLSNPVVQIVEEIAPKIKSVKPTNKPSVDIHAILAALENALEEGSLQQALDLDKSLRNVFVKGNAAQQLASLRAQLHQLLDWAKWGGNVSREELIKVAERLREDDTTEQMKATEIVKQIGVLRSRWRELDQTSGSGAQALWEQFDGACNQAYQIASTQFKQHAQLRQENLAKAQALLADVDNIISDAEQKLPDWKVHQQYINKLKVEWRNIGSVDRKAKVQIEAEFQKKITALLQPLIEAQRAAMELRNQLIDSVAQINATDRNAADQVQQAQQRWQQEAVNVPLEHKAEQQLWHKFRAACDGVFAERKAKAEEQHQRRDQILLEQQAYCAELESITSTTSAETTVLINNAKRKWQDLSRQYHQQKLTERFNSALIALKKHQSKLLVNEKKAALQNLRAKIALCRQVENSEAANDEQKTAWQALPSNDLPTELGKLLTKRFNDASTQSRQVHTASIDELLLHIELQRGLPSPPELAQQRLQLQVKELQSALTNRNASGTYANNFYTLCALPVNLNEQQEKRFQAILDDYTI